MKFISIPYARCLRPAACCWGGGAGVTVARNQRRQVAPSDITSIGTSGWKQLDTARLLLSLIVVVAHANYVFITPLGYTAMFPITEWMAKYAVLAFFVLSGLVIGRSLALRRDGFVPS
jgi:hypothetical protein